MSDQADKSCASLLSGERLFHGVSVPDPQRWLRDVAAQPVKDWVAAQDAATDDFLRQLPGFARAQEFLERNAAAPDPVWLAVRGARSFALARQTGLDHPLLVVREADEERVLLDPNALGLSIQPDQVTVSPDGTRVALLVAPPGEVLASIWVLDAATGARLEESDRKTVMPLTAWHPGGQGFWYSLCRRLFGEAAPRDGLYWHALGTPWSADRCVEEYHDGPGHILHAYVAGDWLVLGTRQFSSGQSGFRVVPLPKDPVKLGKPATLFDELEGYNEFLGTEGGELYFHTCVGAPNGRIVAIDPRRPRRDAWRDVVPEGALALAKPERFAGPLKAAVSPLGLLLAAVEDAHDVLRHYGLDGTLRGTPALAELSTVDGIQTLADGFRVCTQSFLVPRVVHRYRDGALTEVARVALPHFDPARYELKQEFATAGDGTRIPLYILQARGQPREPTTPAQIYGYGGFGQSIGPEYSPAIALWLFLGGIYAVANIRGGGEYGERWHRAGSGLAKQNTFDDFYAAAQYLIAEGYTSAAHLVARGISNGGLLTTVCANQRPDLFAALVSEVPLADMLGLDDTTTGQAVAAEYGNPRDRAAFDVLRSYSPLHNIRDDVRTPAHFVVAAEHDVSAQPQQIYPYVAARQAAIARSPHYAPVLLRLVRGEGHTEWPPATTRRTLAEQTAFLHHFALQGPYAHIAQQRGLRVPMRDGVELVTNVWQPASGGPVPAVLLRTPYENDAGQLERLGLRAYVEAGYAVVLQSTRGRGGSGGSFRFFFAEGPDGYDTVEWIAAQRWCDGKVAMDGGSYLGTAQWLAAREQPPHLACIMPAVPAGDWFNEIPYMGGALQVDWAFSWLGSIAGVKFDFDTSGDKNLERFRPLAEAGSVLGAELPEYRDILRHPTPDAWWQPLLFSPTDFAGIRLPVFTVTGWFDGDQAGTLHYWHGLARHSPHAPAELIIGPWEHPHCYLGGEPVLRELRPGPDSVLPIRELRLAFLDEHLRGRPRLARPPRARVFTTGSNRWHEFDAYPPRTGLQRWFLASGGRANTAAGDGRLSLAGAAGTPDRFEFDPCDPVPYKPGAADHRGLEDRADVLVYTSDALVEPLTVIGPVEAVLHVTSSARDTDFTCKLLDVHPDGRAVSLTHVGGVLRARYRYGQHRPEPLVPDRPATLPIRLSHVGHTFLPGHRLRLEVSSSCFPMVEPNTNTGTDPATETRVVRAQQSVLHDADNPSHLLLPIWR